MPALVAAAIAPGSLCRRKQPRLDLGHGLVARPWRPEDATFLRESFGDPAIQRFHVHRVDSDDEARAWLGQWPQQWEQETAASWAIASADNEEAMGQIGLRGVRLDEARARISFWLSPHARGKGIDTDAATTITDWAMNELGLQRVGLVHSVANVSSCRVAERAGFALEGTLRRYGLHADGWHDMHLHARTVGV